MVDRVGTASHIARAGLAIAIGLCAWTTLATRSIPALCEAPVEREANVGHTTMVGCDGDRSGQPPLRGPARRLFGYRVDLNCSDLLTLETLAGIGPARARAIVAERARGPYRRVDDLTRVRGIGPKTLARLRGELVVEPGPTSVESPGCRTNG